MKFKKMIVVVGHYGSGKTEFSLNLALKLKDEGNPVTIVDADVVNPYFRTNDIKQKLKNAGIKVIAPIFASTNVDIPSLPGEIYSAFEDKGYVIFDVGGNDDGALVLGRFNSYFMNKDYEMLAVVNTKRPLTSTADEIVDSIKEIEVASRLKVSGIIDNTNLSFETTANDILEDFDIVAAAASVLDLPIKAVCVKNGIQIDIKQEYLFKMDIQLSIP